MVNQTAVMERLRSRQSQPRALPEWADGSVGAFNATPADALVDHYQMVPHDRLHRWENQPRQQFPDEEITELKDEILENRTHGSGGLERTGIEQPLIVCPHPELEGHYVIIEGERRWRATEGTAVTELPCIVRAVTHPGEMLEIALAIGINRENWSPVDEGIAIKRWMGGENQTGQKYTIRPAAARLGKAKGYIENRLRLADAPPEVQAMVSLRKDTLSHAYHILQIPDATIRQRFIHTVLRDGASVKQIDNAVSEFLGKVKAPPAAPALELPVLPVEAFSGTVPAADYTPSHHQPAATGQAVIEWGHNPQPPRQTPAELPEITLAGIASALERLPEQFRGGMKSAGFVAGVRRDLERVRVAVAGIEAELQ